MAELPELNGASLAILGLHHDERGTILHLSRDTGEATLWLEIVPPLDRGTAWIDMVTAGQSAEVRAGLLLRGWPAAGALEPEAVTA